MRTWQACAIASTPWLSPLVAQGTYDTFRYTLMAHVDRRHGTGGISGESNGMNEL